MNSQKHMNLLAVDFGDRKVGVAIATSFLAEPLVVLRYSSLETLFEKLSAIISEYAIEKIIVGVSEGESADKAYEFGEKLSKTVQLPVEFQDETLSTYDAQQASIQSNMSRKKRKMNEDAYAAAFILQSFIDRHDN